MDESVIISPNMDMLKDGSLVLLGEKSPCPILFIGIVPIYGNQTHTSPVYLAEVAALLYRPDHRLDF